MARVERPGPYSAAVAAARVARVYDVLDHEKGGEPCSFNEIVRKTGIFPKGVSHALRQLREKGQAESRVVDGRLMDRYVGVLHYFRYDLWYLTKTLKTAPHLIREKRDVIWDISKVGLDSSMHAERALAYACWRTWGYPAVEVSPYESRKPDCIIPDRKILCEISIRDDNPIDTHYLTQKYIHKPPDYKGILFGVKIKPDVYPLAKKYGYDIKQLPFDTFPIFAHNRRYQRLFIRVNRPTTIIRFWDFVGILTDFLRPYKGI